MELNISFPPLPLDFLLLLSSVVFNERGLPDLLLEHFVLINWLLLDLLSLDLLRDLLDYSISVLKEGLDFLAVVFGSQVSDLFVSILVLLDFGDKGIGLIIFGHGFLVDGCGIAVLLERVAAELASVELWLGSSLGFRCFNFRLSWSFWHWQLSAAVFVAVHSVVESWVDIFLANCLFWPGGSSVQAEHVIKTTEGAVEAEEVVLKELAEGAPCGGSSGNSLVGGSWS